MRSLSRPRYRSPSTEFAFLGGGPPGYWPQHQSYSPRRKKKIIIVQNGIAESKKTRRSRLNSNSDSDVSVVIKDVTPRSRKSRQVTESESSDSSVSRSRSREKKQRQSKSVPILKESKNKKIQTGKRKNNKNTKQKKKQESDDEREEKIQKNIRFDLDHVKARRFSKSKAVQIEQNSTPEPQSEVATPEPEIPKINAVIEAKPSKSTSKPIQEERVDVQSSVNPIQKPAAPDKSLAASSRNQTPVSMTSPIITPTPKLDNTPKALPIPNESKKKVTNNKTPENDDQELLATLAQLDKRADFELEQLKGGNLRKLPPDVNLAMKKKIFSPEFQRNIDHFLES